MPPPGAALPGSDRSKTAQASGHRSQESPPAAQARGSTCRIAWQSPDRELPLEEEESESLHQHEARHQIRWAHCRRPGVMPKTAGDICAIALIVAEIGRITE